MDNNRTRDSRRLSMPSTSTPRRRQHPTISLRGSSQEGGQVELQETVRLRGKRERERDRDSSKRRRASHSHSTEDSDGNEQDGDVLDAGASRLLCSNTASSAPDRNTFRPLRPTPPLPWKITDEIIGVAVPRKTRSASVKRVHESWVSPTAEEQSAETASPSTSTVSVRKKMKSIGPKTRLPKGSKSSTQEEIEIEIAELLYGMKTSNTHDSSCSQKQKPESLDAAEKKKADDFGSFSLAPNNSDAEFVRIESEQTAKVGKVSPESAQESGCRGDNASGHEIGSSEGAKKLNGEPSLNSGAGCGVTADARSEFFTGESQSCFKSKLDPDKKEDSTSTKAMCAVQGDKGQRVDKFEIDLMAPPPMMPSPERDNLPRGEDGVKVDDKAERLPKKEKTKEEIEEVKMAASKDKLDVLKLDLEKPNKHDIATNNKLEQQDSNKEQPTQSTDPKVEKTGQSSSVPLSTAGPERQSSLSSIGYIPPLQTVLKMDKTPGSSTAPQHVNFILSQPRPKRCATHHYIAHNIISHQQYTKMNPVLPSAAGSGSLCDIKSNNINRMPSAESMVVGKKSQKHSAGVNQNAAQEKGLAPTSDYSRAAIESSGPVNLMDPTQMKQLVFQQGPHPGSAGNLVHGPAFLFPPGPHQASVTTTTTQAAGVNSTSSVSSSNKSRSSAAGSVGTSSTLPGVAAASMSFSYPNLAANDAPYVTIVQNNGYPFPFSTPLGASAAIRGASHAQAPPLPGGPLYPSQMFYPFQHPQQHPHSQALVQPSYHNASTSSGSSPSHKQSQGTQVNGNSILTSTTMQQQSQKQHTSLSHPRKHETGMVGENAPSVASGTAYSQKNVFGQNFTIPDQPMNLSFRPSATSDSVGGNSGNFGDNQQQQGLKGGVERLPSQAFAISFAAFNGTSVPSNLNFSSMAQSPVIFQSMPDIAWQGYQAASTCHSTQQKNYSITEGKSGGNSSHQDDEKRTTSGKPSNNGPTTLVFDNSSKNLNFVPSPMNGNWPSRSITSTASSTSLPLSINASSSQQPPQLLHLQQQQHGVLQQQAAMSSRYKASSSNATTATKFVNSPPVFSQPLTQSKSSNQASQSKSSGRTPDSQVHNSSIITSTPPTLKSFSLEQGRALQGHTQISFGGNYMPSLPPQGQQVLSNNQLFGTTVAGTPPKGSNSKTNSQGSKVVSSVNTSQMQQTENASAGTGQKSSPVCGRNVASILSSCPSHLSELKY